MPADYKDTQQSTAFTRCHFQPCIQTRRRSFDPTVGVVCVIHENLGRHWMKDKMIEQDSDYIVVNEAFPHIGKKIGVFWGYPEFVALMLNLQQNDRGSSRQGFPAKVLASLIKLEEKHDLEFPRLKRQIESSWHTL